MDVGVIMALLVVAVMLALSLKSRSPEISSLVSVAICIVVIGLCITRISAIIDLVHRLTEYISIDSTYIMILLKLIGIAYLCEFACGISKDAGYSAIASQIELLGKLTMLMVSVPVLLKVIESIMEMSF
ncbi:MAG: stage III sporulation protein AD [Lachnospiraceae bacterium]|nr:stage III sporulation protein AD [Lachnospiraceae bacterium]